MFPARVFVSALAICSALVCAGCFSDPEKDAENKKKVEALLARLPEGWKAEIEVKGDIVTIRNFTGKWSLEGAAAFDLAFDELKAEGVNFDSAGKPEGPPPLKRLTLKNLRDGVVFTKELNFSFSHSLGLLEVNAPHGDFAGLLAVIDAKAEPEMLLKTLNSWKVGAVRLEKEVLDFSYEYFGTTSKLESLSLASASLFRWEGFEAKKLSVMSLGVEVVALDSYGYKLVQLPDLADLVELVVQQKKETGKDLGDPAQIDREIQRELAAMLRATPVRVEGLTYNNLRVRPMTTDSIRAGKLSFDLFFSPDKLLVNYTGKDLEVPATVLAMAAPPREFGLRAGESFKGESNLRWEMKAGQTGGTGALNMTAKLLDWGGTELSLDLGFPVGDANFPAFPAGEDTMLLYKSSLTIEDRGGIERTLAARGESRRQMMDRLLQGEPLPGLGGELQKAVLLLAEKGGTVRLSLVCDPPEPLSRLEELAQTPPASWKVVLEHTPLTGK